MNKKKNSIIVLATCMLLILSCKKENSPLQSELAQLPPATQTGANTFGCIANGKVFVSNKLTCSFILTAKTSIGNYYSFTMAAVDSTSPDKQKISVYLPGIMAFKNNRTFAINAPPNSVNGWYALYEDVATDGLISDYRTTYSQVDEPLFSNPMTFLKVDTVNKIFSGTFSWNMTDSDGSLIALTNGRFDVNYTTN